MLISQALAHGGLESGSSGGGNALLIILGVAIVLATAYVFLKKWRKNLAERTETADQPTIPHP